LFKHVRLTIIRDNAPICTLKHVFNFIIELKKKIEINYVKSKGKVFKMYVII